MSALSDEQSRFRTATVAALVLGVLAVLVLNVVPTANNDIWLLMKVGELIVDTGHIPQTLLFPFTAVRDNHFNAHEWLASVIFHGFDRAFGADRLMWVIAPFALLQFALCVLLTRRQSRSLGAALLLSLLAMLCANSRFVLRPELFALVFLVCLLLVLDRYRRGGRRTTLLWTLPIAVLWANSHGSFLLGPVAAGLFALGEALTVAHSSTGPMTARLRAGWRVGVPYALAGLAMTAACMANPFGWHLLAFPFQLQQSVATRMLVKEWLPTFAPLVMHERPFWIFVVIAAAAVALITALRRHLRATEALLFLFFLALALDRSRHFVWFGFVAATVCARLLGQVTFERRHEMRLRLAAALFSLVALCVSAVVGNAAYATFNYAPSNNLGPALVRELSNPAVKGPVLTSYELGAEVIYRWWPRLQPSIDSRIDSYGDDYALFHVRLLRDEKLLDLFLDGNRVNEMLLLRRDLDLGVRSMPSIRANWHIRLTDGDVF
ncbi:MAG: hypothetical protein JF626_11510, partial [Polaromonas sp.]|nr:hypothetical protein [Polaromonas sp.]